MNLDQYTIAFTKLKADKKNFWPEATFHCAPYKPILLMSVMDLLAQQIINSNAIRLNADLMDAFDLYWVRIVGNERESNSIMPFYHMCSEGFWRLVDDHGVAPNLRLMNRNEVFRQIKSQTLFAQLNEDLFQLLQDSESRDALRRVLIENWFSPEIRPTVVEVSHITTSSFAYSRDLLNRSRGRFTLQEAPLPEEQYATEVRSTAFRRVVVDAYQHTCALCGIRIVTPEGRTAVAAAHIVPWSHSHNDDPRNGMALCGLHHWIFDQGLITVTPKYIIRTSPVLALNEQHAASVLMLNGKAIYKPTDQALWPASVALHWHMERIFRPVGPHTLS